MQSTKMRWQELVSVRHGSAQSVVRARLYARNPYAFRIDAMQYTYSLFCTQTDRRYQHRTRGTHSQSQTQYWPIFPLLSYIDGIPSPMYSDLMCEQRYCIERKSNTRITYITVWSQRSQTYRIVECVDFRFSNFWTNGSDCSGSQTVKYQQITKFHRV